MFTKSNAKKSIIENYIDIFASNSYYNLNKRKCAYA